MEQQPVEVVKQPLPLLSNSFYKDLQRIAQIYKCTISKALIAAHNGRIPVTNFCRMVTARDVTNESLAVDAAENIAFSFLPKDKEPEYSENGNWARKNRQTGKPAKIAQSLLELDVSPVTVKQLKISRVWHDYHESVGLASIPGKASSMQFINETNLPTYESREIKRNDSTYTPKMYETFANNIKSYYECRFEFKIVEGDDLNKFYHSDYYYDKDGAQGTLWGSCMRQADAEWFDIYSKNGVKMLIALYCEKIVARALVWTTDKGVFMDRIYTYYDYLEKLFITYAEDNRWMYKTNQSAGDPEKVMKYDEEKDKYTSGMIKLTANVTHIPEYYPYCDTFKHFDGHSYLHNDNKCEERYILESTDGDRILQKGVECYVCRDMYDPEDLHYVERRDRYVCNDHGVQDYNGDWQVTGDCRQLYDGRYALSSETVLLTSTSTYNYHFALRDEIYRTYDGRVILKEECVQLDNGSWAGVDDSLLSKDDKGKWFINKPTPEPLPPIPDASPIVTERFASLWSDLRPPNTHPYIRTSGSSIMDYLYQTTGRI